MRQPLSSSNTIPVSYTHLDVYKRQVLDLLLADVEVEVSWKTDCLVLPHIFSEPLVLRVTVDEVVSFTNAEQILDYQKGDYLVL